MTPKRIIPVALLVLAGILCASAAFFGGTSLLTGVRHAHSAILLLFCIPLILLLPFFCVTFFRPRLSVILQLCDALVFLGADYFVHSLDCAASHSCPGVVSIAISSFLQPVTLVPFMIAALQLLSIYMHEWVQMPQGERRSI